MPASGAWLCRRDPIAWLGKGARRPLSQATTISRAVAHFVAPAPLRRLLAVPLTSSCSPRGRVAGAPATRSDLNERRTEALAAQATSTPYFLAICCGGERPKSRRSSCPRRFREPDARSGSLRRMCEVERQLSSDTVADRGGTGWLKADAATNVTGWHAMLEQSACPDSYDGADGSGEMPPPIDTEERQSMHAACEARW